MKKLITLLGTLVATSSTGNVLSNISNHDNNKITNLPKNDLKVNYSNTTITQQNTIYIDKNGKQQTTSEKDLSTLDTIEIIQIGFYKNVDGQICAIKMPRMIKKVPNQIPQEITNVIYMFASTESFNQDLSTWNVSNVTNMESMFADARSFNQNLSTWNVSNVTNMKNMFADARSFNQDLSKWDTSNVTNMNGMFACAVGSKPTFNQDLSTWNVSNVTNMSDMFYGLSTFNKSISTWNVSKVTDMSYMFYSASTFNQDLSKWNVSNVTNMSEMFSEATSFNQNLSTWNVSNVTNMTGIFVDATSFNQDLSTWNVSNVTNMSEMFYSASAFNQDLSKWDTSKVTNMSSMFESATSFNQDLSKWNVSKVTSWKNFATNSGITDPNKLPKFNKLHNTNLFENSYRFLAHNWLKVKISCDIFSQMISNYNNKEKSESEKKHELFIIINNFPKLDNTGWFGNIIEENIHTVAKIIIDNFKEINNFFKNQKSFQGLLIVTNTIGSWDKNDYMGVFAQ